MFSPAYVRRIPDNLPAFDADLNTISRLKDANYDLSQISAGEVDYRWVFDFDEIADQIKTVISVDTEGTGLRWWPSPREVVHFES